MNASAAWLSVGALGLSWVVAARSPFDPFHPDPKPQAAQESQGDSQAGRLQRAPARGQSPFGVPGEVEFDREDWSERLQSPDLEARERSFDELLDLARGAAGESTRAALEEWAAADDELAWTSRLALRELHRTRGLYNLRGGPLFLDHSPFQGFFDFRPHGGGGGGGADLPALMEELQRQLDDMMSRPRGGTSRAPGSGGQTRSESQSFQLESGPDGVRVEIERRSRRRHGDQDLRGREPRRAAAALSRAARSSANRRLFPEVAGRFVVQGPARWHSGESSPVLEPRQPATGSDRCVGRLPLPAHRRRRGW